MTILANIVFFCGVFFMIFGIFLPFYLKKANRFLLTSKRILALRGWFSHQLISIEYEKITNIKVEQNFLERIFFKTGSLIIETAGTPYPELVLFHVENPYHLQTLILEAKNKLKLETNP